MAPVRSAIALCALLTACAAPVVDERVQVSVDISDQRMTVTAPGIEPMIWPVSTARTGKVTPRGTFTPQLLKERHFSTLYDDAPMPWSIFFTGHYAIHGTTQISRLGSPASAGCIRLDPMNAQVLFGLVQEAGKANTIITIRD